MRSIMSADANTKVEYAQNWYKKMCHKAEFRSRERPIKLTDTSTNHTCKGGKEKGGGKNAIN